jgi:hypothetical protein
LIDSRHGPDAGQASVGPDTGQTTLACSYGVFPTLIDLLIWDVLLLPLALSSLTHQPFFWLTEQILGVVDNTKVVVPIETMKGL